MIGDINFDGVVNKKDKKTFRTYLDEKDEYSQGKISSFSMSSNLRDAIAKYGDIDNNNKIDDSNLNKKEKEFLDYTIRLDLDEIQKRINKKVR